MKANIPGYKYGDIFNYKKRFDVIKYPKMIYSDQGSEFDNKSTPGLIL